MKYLLHIIAICLIGLSSSCGEFYTFDELAPVDSVTMRVAQDTAYIMVGDTMALKVKFEPPRTDVQPVFWSENRTVNDTSAVILNDTITAVSAGEVEVVAYGLSGTVSDTCHVVVFDRWPDENFSAMQPSDMVIYGDITVGGEPWKPETQFVAAFARGTIIGYAVQKEAFGIKYALLRLWSLADENVGVVTFRCYDREKHMLYQAAQRPDFTALRALGTLSNLYQITF